MADSKAASAHAERIAQIRAALPEIATHLTDYAKGKIGASGADERICIILFQVGYAQNKQIPPDESRFPQIEPRRCYRA